MTDTVNFGEGLGGGDRVRVLVLVRVSAKVRVRVRVRVIPGSVHSAPVKYVDATRRTLLP